MAHPSCVDNAVIFRSVCQVLGLVAALLALSQLLLLSDMYDIDRYEKQEKLRVLDALMLCKSAMSLCLHEHDTSKFKLMVLCTMREQRHLL